MVHVYGKKVGGNANICKFTAYVSPYFVVSNGGAYTKHIYAASQRIASKLGNEDGFGADPRRVEMAGGKKYDDNQSGTIKARFEALNIDYSDGNGKKDDEEYEPTMDSEEEEKLIFFYHPDHLGSTSYVTDADGNIAQHVEYIPYGEVFVEERNSQFSTNFLFNAKELDNETGLYYYGARYLDPTGAMWLSVDPMWENFAGMSPYNYCMGNPVKMVDLMGMEPTENYGFNIELPEFVFTAPSPSPNQEEVTLYNHIPVGEDYINSRQTNYGDLYHLPGWSAKGGCTYAAAKSILDFFHISYNRSSIDKYRTMQDKSGNFKNVFRSALAVKKRRIDESITCDEIRKANLDVNEIFREVSSMRIDGTAFALTYKNTSQPDGHTVVVMGVSYNSDGTPKGFQCWDNAGDQYGGRMTTVYPGAVLAIYRVKKKDYNPWIFDVEQHSKQFIFEK